MLSELNNIIWCGKQITKQPTTNQLDNYIKCARHSKCIKINNNRNLASHYNKTSKYKHTKSNLKTTNILEASSDTSRGNSNKQTQSQVNLKLKSGGRKTMRMISPKF